MIEMLVVIAIVGVLAAISTPFFLDMVQNSRYRDGARITASALREARSQAVSTNQRHRLVANLENRVLTLQRDEDGTWATQRTFGPLTPALRGGTDCSADPGTVEILFNPSGSSTTNFICLLDRKNAPRFLVGVPSATSGRVTIQRRSGSGWN
jgi:prepilin-type N-terminal cleavage/methylation domain-containing protein